MSTEQSVIKWEWKPFDQISGLECWSMLELRQNVFLLEQECQYADVDRLDLDSWHLFGWEQTDSDSTPALAAYQRLVPPNSENNLPSLGRIVIHPNFRGKGLGKDLVCRGIEKVESLFPRTSVRISAQQHLEKFYCDLGFHVESEPYMDAGIPHIKMLLPNKANKQ